MPRGMISAPPFMPPFGSRFPGGMPFMPPLPGSMPQMPNMPPMQQQPPAPPAAQQGMPGQPVPGPYQKPPLAGQLPWAPGPSYDPVALQHLAAVQQAIQAQQAQQAQLALQAQLAQQVPAPAFLAAEPDPVWLPRAEALPATLPVTPDTYLPELGSPTVAEIPPLGGEVHLREEEPAPPIGRVQRAETYTTKGWGIQYSTRG